MPPPAASSQPDRAASARRQNKSSALAAPAGRPTARDGHPFPSAFEGRHRDPVPNAAERGAARSPRPGHQRDCKTQRRQRTTTRTTSRTTTKGEASPKARVECTEWTQARAPYKRSGRKRPRRGQQGDAILQHGAVAAAAAVAIAAAVDVRKATPRGEGCRGTRGCFSAFAFCLWPAARSRSRALLRVPAGHGRPGPPCCPLQEAQK